MLFNKSTGKPRTNTDILSLDSLIAWLEQQPMDGTYSYIKSRGCLLSQYFTAMGLREVSVTPGRYRAGLFSYTYKLLPEGWEEIANGFPLGAWTFGKALARARKLQKVSAK